MSTTPEQSMVKSGFVVFLGRSNVGKSTLLNTIVGTKIASVTNKPQTTRNIIHGIVHDERGQIVFVDTPGILKEQHSVLSGKLVERVKESLQDIDCVVYVTDPSREIGPEERFTMALIRSVTIPKIFVINKIDLPNAERKYIDDYRYLAEEERFDTVIELSALKSRHIAPLKDAVFAAIPEIPADQLPYPEGQLTNMNEKFWVAEIVREKIFLATEKEVPYSVTVEVDEIEDKEEVMVITGRIITTADRYKKMIIGRGGRKIKEVGQMARKELEQAINKKIYLELEVETNPKWESLME